jgi:hypothetical protein
MNKQMWIQMIVKQQQPWKSTKTPLLRKNENETAENRVTSPFRNTQSQTLFPLVGSRINYLH